MEYTTSLHMYRAEKFNITKEGLYVNSRGSALIFEARAGRLKIKSFMEKHTQNDGGSVKETKTTRHIVLECDCIHPKTCQVNSRRLALNVNQVTLL